MLRNAEASSRWRSFARVFVVSFPLITARGNAERVVEFEIAQRSVDVSAVSKNHSTLAHPVPQLHLAPEASAVLSILSFLSVPLFAVNDPNPTPPPVGATKKSRHSAIEHRDFTINERRLVHRARKVHDPGALQKPRAGRITLHEIQHTVVTKASN